MPAVRVQERNGAFLAFNLEVSRLRLWWHAAFTGGSLPEGSTPMQRFRFRRSNVSAVNSFLRPTQDEWRATPLYHGLETTEKSFASYRLGTTFAGVFADRTLGIRTLQHRQAIFGSSSGQRGDLVGLSSVGGRWHGVEAKGHSPLPPGGGYRAISDKEYDAAKAQACTLADVLDDEGYPTAEDHWAVSSLTSTQNLVRMVVEDPAAGEGPGGDDGEPPADTDTAFADFEGEERLLQAYYQVVGDIEARAQSRGFSEAPEDVGGRRVLGVRIGGRYWLGADVELFAARREGRLAALVADRYGPDALEVETEHLLYGANGLAFARLPRTVG